MYHIKRIKTHNHFNRCRKSVSQNLTLFHDKMPNKLKIEGDYLNRIKAIYKKLTTNIIDRKRLKAFPLRSGIRLGCHSHASTNMVLEIITRTVRQEKEVRGIWIRKEEVKLSLLTNDMILFVENPKDPPSHIQKTELIKGLSNVTGYEVNTQKSVAFYTPTMSNSEKETKKTIPLQWHRKKLKYFE